MLIRGLTLTCPWGPAIAYWGKDVENRTWAPPQTMVGHYLAIHAGKSPFRARPDGTLVASEAVLDELRETLAGIRLTRFAETADSQPGPVTPTWLHERSSAIIAVAQLRGWVHDEEAIAGFGVTSTEVDRGRGLDRAE